jgi:sulfite reductase (NADPH) flavoprotein alpha-component
MAFSLFRSRPRTGGRLLVAFASQTGAAERIAWLTANALAGVRPVRVVALGALTAVDLAQAGSLLVVTSTYGAGEAPDSARAFVRKEMTQAPSFKGLDYAVLALGDRKYDATFCGFGRDLDRWLARGKAKRLFEIVCVNGDDDEAAMGKWAAQLNQLGATTSGAALMPGAPQGWLLAERRLLNAGSPGGEAWHVALAPKDAATWTAGDIAEVWPRNAQADVEAFMARHDLNGELSFKWQGNWTFLRDIIAHSRLPRDHEVEGVALEWLVQRLEAFAPREYSIASLPSSSLGRMELLVRKAVKADGSVGLGSGWLTQVAAVGGIVKLRLRPNPNFQPPPDGPMILIGAGTGMAGLRAHLLHRQQKKLVGAWLLLGERSAAHDLYYADDIKAWQADGTLAKTSLVFSRDAAPPRYVQHLVTEQGPEICAWLARGASVMVCGGLDMAAGVQEALVSLCGQEKLDGMIQDGLYRRDIY